MRKPAKHHGHSTTKIISLARFVCAIAILQDDVFVCWHLVRYTDRQTDRLKDRQTYRQTGRQTDRQTERQTDREVDRGLESDL